MAYKAMHHLTDSDLGKQVFYLFLEDTQLFPPAGPVCLQFSSLFRKQSLWDP